MNKYNDNNSILHWDQADYSAIYKRQLREAPVYWNAEQDTWMVYSYNYCKEVLLHEAVQVPEPFVDPLLNERSRALMAGLARITNNGRHIASRQSAIVLYQSIKAIPTEQVIALLLKPVGFTSFDFVNAVAKKLPVLVVAKGLGLNNADCDYIIENIGVIVRILSPDKSVEDIQSINVVVSRFYAIANGFIKTNLPYEYANESKSGLFAANLIGLLIQSYDAGRGLLCNALINLFGHLKAGEVNPGDRDYFKNIVTETLRLHSPVHYSRRIAISGFSIGGKWIKTGKRVTVVLAAANIDPVVFKDADVYNPLRANNNAHLSFGAGGHQCIAKYFCLDLVADTCRYFADNYPMFDIPAQVFNYEPMLNVRLIKKLIIKLK